MATSKNADRNQLTRLLKFGVFKINQLLLTVTKLLVSIFK